MEKLVIGKNKVYLISTEIGDNSYAVTFNLVNEYGIPIYKDILATFDDKAIQYYVEFEAKEADIPGAYPRGIWKAEKDSNRIPLKNYMTEFEFIKDFYEVQLVPVDYFTQYAMNPEIDARIKAAIRRTDKENIRTMLQAGTADLARAIQIDLYPKEHKAEMHDLFSEAFIDTFWQQQLYFTPIVKITNFDVYYGNQKVMELDPAEHFVIDLNVGTMEFLPTALNGATVYSRFINAIAAVGSSFTGSGLHRIPGFFRITYTAGIDFINLDKADQESFRRAICHHAMLKELWRLDPNLYGGSISKSIDGASKSVSYAGIPFLQALNLQHMQWIADTRKFYGKEWIMHFA